MDEKKFYVAKLEDDDSKEQKKGANQFVSPFLGRNVKNEMKPPVVNYGNGGLQYDDLRSEKDRKRNQSDEKYSPERIPSYLRGEQSSITRRSIEDLKGKKYTDEERYEMYRRSYGIYDMDAFSKESNQTPADTRNDIQEEEFADFEEDFEIEDFEEPVVSKPSPSLQDDEEFIRFIAKPDVKPTPVVEQVEQRIVVKPEKPKPVPRQTYNRNKKYKFPPLDLLRRGNRSVGDSQADTTYQINTINSTLEQFKIGGHIINHTKGPTVTQYEVKLDPGVLVSKVENIGRNLQMNLAVDGIRIEAPIPGKPTVGIEVPNVKADSVLFGDMVSQQEFLHDGKPLNVILGLQIDGRPQYLNICDMPHAIVAGSTNSGKTVCIHSIINSILYKATPEEVRLVLVDPKSNEFMFYEGIPHLASPIIDDPKYASSTMSWAADEMKRRFEILKQARKNKISDYNDYVERTGEGVKLPYIVIIIDEFADLMNTASDTFEKHVQRLTQKARSVGIHMIIATQRPSVDVIKGTIKANIQTRIALKVNNQVDSQTILDHSGAEKLLGRGDALYTKGGPDIRIQCAYISVDEIEQVTDFLRNEYNTPYMFTLDELEMEEPDTASPSSNPLSDPLFAKVAKYVVTYKNASMNQIQKDFNIGYNRADEIMSGLQSLGIVSPVVHGKQRSVMIDIEQLEELIKKKS